MKRTICLLLAAAALLTVQTALGESGESFVPGDYCITEQDGRNGLADAEGNTVLPAEYYIPDDQFSPEEDAVCIAVYQAVEHDYRHGTDLDMELEDGLMRGGFFHTGSGYFSGCLWRDVWCIGDYAAVCDEELCYTLLNAGTGETLLAGQYAWICPEVSDSGWVYVWLFSEEGDEAWLAAYVNLDGRTLTAPEGFSFSEEPEAVENGMVRLYDNETGEETRIGILELLEE